MYKCPRCKTEKPINEFVKRSDRKSGVSCCKDCELTRKSNYARLYRARNREIIRIKDREYSKKFPERRRRTNLKRFYKITPEKYDEMLVKQDNKCLLCGYLHRPDSKKREDKLQIDHCHTRGHVRGLLCAQCNKGLGCFKDDISTLLKAIQYLQDNNT